MRGVLLRAAYVTVHWSSGTASHPAPQCHAHAECVSQSCRGRQKPGLRRSVPTELYGGLLWWVRCYAGVQPNVAPHLFSAGFSARRWQIAGYEQKRRTRSPAAPRETRSIVAGSGTPLGVTGVIGVPATVTPSKASPESNSSSFQFTTPAWSM